MTSKSIIHETQIFGPLTTWMYYTQTDKILIEADENYQKRSYRNRYTILSANGKQTLSIPLKKGKNQQMKIKDVKISYDEPWSNRHIQAIQSAYGKSAYFEFYFDDIKRLLSSNEKFLFDLNKQCLTTILSFLNLDNDVSFTEDYHTIYSDQDILDLRGKTDVEDSNFAYYPQVWEEKYNFVPNLSILDVLFCMGPVGVEILSKSLSLNYNHSF